MKKTIFEKELEEFQRLLTKQMEESDDPGVIKELLNKIHCIREMRLKIELNKRDNDASILRTVLQMGIPMLATVTLAIIGFTAEANVGNPSGFTLRWLFNRAPK